MIYLSGTIRPQLTHPMLGFLETFPRWHPTRPGVPWAADNGRFTAPHAYTDESYLAWLVEHRSDGCLFATAPDVVADHDATVEMSLPLFPRIREAGYPAAFAAQDGWREDTTPWDDFDVLFIGGSNTFKLGRGADAVHAGKRHGKHVHMGRVNSYRRLRLAAILGCDSVDGTFLKFAPDINEPRMFVWFERLCSEPTFKSLSQSV